VEFCTVEQLLNRNVIVLCNLKPRPLKGILSAGMLLCASSIDKTQVRLKFCLIDLMSNYACKRARIDMIILHCVLNR
jgi:tRNA-binding EMAP/Myf-like protein